MISLIRYYILIEMKQSGVVQCKFLQTVLILGFQLAGNKVASMDYRKRHSAAFFDKSYYMHC